MAKEFIRVTGGPAAGATIQLNGDVTFGRNAADAGALGGDAELSREHARITRAATGDLLVQDLGSTNGTFVNGQRIAAPTPLRPGDQVQLGTSTLELAADGAQTAIASTPPPVHQATKAGAPAPAPVAQQAPATPRPAAPPRRPAGPAPEHPALAPAPRDGGLGGRTSLLAAILGILIGGGIAAAIWAGDDSSAASPVERFSLMAEGFSAETFDERSGQREIVITMKTFEAPHEIEELHLHKYLDETTPPPQRTYDAIYTFTAQNGDTLVLSAAGDVTEPQGPDRFFGQTFEQWRVVNGTGNFEGAIGEGTITTAVNVAGRGPQSAPTGSNVVKHIQGELELRD